MRSAVVCAILALGASLPAQGTLQLGQTVELGSSAAGDADHATVAVNSSGDVFVAWSALRTDLNPPTLQVEGAYLRYLGAGTWEIPQVGGSAGHWVLGDPMAGVYGAAPEPCRKPDVTAMGSDFAVTWPRSNAAGTQSRLEIVRIVVTGSGPPAVDGLAPGVGHVVDPAVDAESAGVMPDLVTLAAGPAKAGVVYADAEAQSPPYREFDVRYARVDFGATPPVVEGPMVLVDDLPCDDSRISGEPAGGRVLPDVVSDDLGSLVLSYETYVRAGHQGAAQDEGRVVASWFANGSSGTPSLLASRSFGGRQPSDLVRRPNLAASRLDPWNSASLTYMDLPDGGGDSDVSYFELLWQSGTIRAKDHRFPNHPSRSDGLPVPGHGSALRFSLSTRDLGGASQIKAFAPLLPGRPFRTVPAPTSQPWRPSTDLMEPAPPDLPAYSALIPVTYEGPTLTGGATLRIFLVIRPW